MTSSEFKDLNLESCFVEQCTAMGLLKPTPVQQHCIPKILKGENCIGVAETGSGKTLAFALPILQLLAEDPYGIFALVLTPTRELAIQISDQFKVIGKCINIEVAVVIGGMNMVAQGGQISNLPHIVVATPGRLADHFQSGNDVPFRRTKILVLDEADRLLDGQFTEQLEVIFEKLLSKRQTLLFSATMTENLEELQQISKVEPFIWRAESNVSTVEKLEQFYVLVPLVQKNTSLVQLVDNFQFENPDSAIIIFTKNCTLCQLVSMVLKRLDFDNVALNSMLKQKERLVSISKFKSNQIRILVATDVASRGLDIPMVDLVINYNIPPVAKNYIHRVGRTARAGRGGRAITFVSTTREILALKNIEEEINIKLTEFKISEKKGLNIMKDVKVAWAEAEISLEDNEDDEKKQIYKRKQSILDGTEDSLNTPHKIKPMRKKFKKPKKSFVT